MVVSGLGLVVVLVPNPIVVSIVISEMASALVSSLVWLVYLMVFAGMESIVAVDVRAVSVV